MSLFNGMHKQLNYTCSSYTVIVTWYIITVKQWTLTATKNTLVKYTEAKKTAPFYFLNNFCHLVIWRVDLCISGAPSWLSAKSLTIYQCSQQYVMCEVCHCLAVNLLCQFLAVFKEDNSDCTNAILFVETH